MYIKENWDDNDFTSMNWHDSSIYSIILPQDNQLLQFDIDYIFEWSLNKDTNLFNFYISPCTLCFYDVLQLEIDINFHDSIGISIEEIQRKNLNKRDVEYWNYIIRTDKGEISFNSTGFKQIVKSQPVFSDGINLGRK